MIFVRDKGRMCNNILQYGHLYAWGREHGRSTMSMRFAYKYPWFHICDTRYHNFIVYVLAKYAAAWKLIPTVKFNEEKKDYSHEEQMMLNHKMIVAIGWYAQWHDLFMKYKSEILEQYIHIIQQFQSLHQGEKLTVYICGNDPNIQQELYRQQLPMCNVVFPNGNPAEDLCLLSHCDYLIGAPSTFSLVAAMYRDLPLYWIENPDAKLSLDSFKHFDYLFRHIH